MNVQYYITDKLHLIGPEINTVNLHTISLLKMKKKNNTFPFMSSFS